MFDFKKCLKHNLEKTTSMKLDLSTPKFLVAINGDDQVRAFENINIAKENGADGIVLFNDRLPAEQLALTYSILKRDFADFFMAIEFTNCRLKRAHKLIENETDAALFDVFFIGDVEEIRELPIKKYQKFLRLNTVRFDASFFVGVANALIPKSESLGVEPNIQNVMKMRKNLGDFPIGVSNGMHPANIGRFLEYATLFIVRGSLTEVGGSLNHHRVRAMAEVIHHAHEVYANT